jgi:LuxR family maltose regulon positive regulatory protein
MMVDAIQRTKLGAPYVGTRFLQRPRLDKLLAHAMTCRLTVVSASAGCGKTSLLSDWYNRHPVPVAWLSLDSSDSDLRRFILSLVAAIHDAFPAAHLTTHDLLQAVQLPAQEHIVATLLDDLTPLAGDFVIVLDDYHVIHERAVHEFMAALIQYLPHNGHLVIATRVDLPFSLAKLRARGQLAEIRARDLHFTEKEADIFLEQQLGAAVPHDVSAVLMKQTEGWIAGLQLAAISLRNHADLVEFARTFKGDNNRHVMDYLAADVLAQQPRVVREFLLRTSLLDRFCASLCDALVEPAPEAGREALTAIGVSESKAILRRIERSNLFLIPLDDKREWYRYHHLFQEVLRNKLMARISREEIDDLHRRASAWLAANDYIEEALGHLLAAGDSDAAAELVEQNMYAVLNREDWHIFERWLKVLPIGLIERRPGLLVMRAWMFHYQWRLKFLPAELSQAEQLLAKTVETLSKDKLCILRGNLDALWAEVFWMMGDSARSMESAQSALANLPNTHLFVRGFACSFVAFDIQALGQTSHARQMLDQDLEKSGDTVNAYSACVMLAQMLVLQYEGEYRELAQLGSHIYQLAVKNDNRVLQSWACFATGTACYELNDLDRAAEYFAHGIELRYSAHLISVSQCFIGMALTHQAKGEITRANETSAAQYEFDAMLQLQSNLVADRALQAQLYLLQGNVVRAAHWAHTAEHEQFFATWHMLMLPALARATILLAEGTPAGVQQAAAEAQQLLQSAMGAHSRRGQAKVLALQALIYEAQGLHEASLQALEQCVVILQPNGAIRTFVDLGPRMATLLRELHKKGVARDYLSQVLAAFPKPEAVDESSSRTGAHRTNLGVDSDENDLFEPLTRRETEVLSLLVQHRSNKEIAQALFISELTVKSHTGNIYEKLGVKGRLAAIRRATELRLVEHA